MPLWQRRYLTVCGAIIGYCIGYVVCDFAGWPKLTYAPLDRAWYFTATPSPLDMAYLGIVLWALSAALIGGGMVAVATRIAKRELPQTINNLAGAWTLTAFGYAGLYYTWGLWPF